MKTTLELPDDLLRRAKIQAIQEHKKFKDAFAEWLERGMRNSRERKPVRLPKVTKLKGRGPMTIEEIEAAINWGRE